MKFEAIADHQIAVARGEIGIAVALLHLINDIRSELRIEQRRAGFHRRHMIGHGRKRIVIDFDERGRILSEVAIFRHHNRHRLPHITNAIPGNRALPHVHRSRNHVHAGEHVIDEFQIARRQNRDHARARERPLFANRAHNSVRLVERTMQISAVSGAGRSGQKSAAPPQQLLVLRAQNGFAHIAATARSAQ